MTSSLKYANFIIRIGVAVLFGWFGIHKLLVPDYWVNAWMPDWLLAAASSIGITGTQVAYLNGIFEILVALSLLTGVFLNIFSIFAILFLLGVVGTHWDFSSFNEIVVRDTVVIATLVGLLLWPDRFHRR